MNQIEKREYHDEDEIDLLDIIKTILSYKKLIAVVTLVAMILGTVGGYLYNKKKTVSKVVVSLDYPGIKEGKNPDGTAFTQTLPMSVVEDVFETNKNIIRETNVYDFENGIVITGMIPQLEKKKIEEAAKKGEKYVYFPNRYEISTKNDTQVLTEILNKSIKNFVKEYSPKSNIVYLPAIEGYDYPEMQKIVMNKLTALKEIASAEGKKNFVSTKLGYSFDQILFDINVVEKIDVADLYSYISLNGFTNNQEMRRTIYDIEIRDLKLEKIKLTEKAAVVKQMLNDYKLEQSNILIPSIGEVAGNISTDKNYYSKLIEEYLKINTKLKDVDAQISKVEILKTKIKVATPEDVAEINKKFNLITTKINDIIDNLNTINNEYIAVKYGNIIKMDTPVMRVSNGKPLIIFLFGGAMLGLFLSFFLIFIAEVKKEYNKR